MVFLSKIYTRSGDEGQTGLGNGQRVWKNSLRVQSYGEVDELNSVLGIVLIQENCPEKDLLKKIQNDLFDLGADLCFPEEKEEKTSSSLRIIESQVIRLEQSIDRLNEPLPPLKSFILPGGSQAAAFLHLARTICRRAERSLIALHQIEPVNPFAIQYLNRLSDLIFVLTRVANQNGEKDILWQPGNNR